MNDECIAALKAMAGSMAGEEGAALRTSGAREEAIGSMPRPGNSLLLDTSVLVVEYFRYPHSCGQKLVKYEELYRRQPALEESMVRSLIALGPL